VHPARRRRRGRHRRAPLAPRAARAGVVADVATIAVPFGIVGARLYHVVTSPRPTSTTRSRRCTSGRAGSASPAASPAAFLGGYLVCRRRGIAPGAFADAIAPGVAVAQAIGRFGNWFNQELFGRPTTLPWGLEIDPDNPDAVPGAEAYHPTFLYESLWNVGVALAVIWVDRRWKLGHGRAFALYVALYGVGRLWIEGLRIDDAASLGGLRLNQYVSLAAIVGGLAYVWLRRGTTREQDVEPARQDAEEPERAG
jgi:prolipoprotein diacylglyceryl transferase